MAGITFQPGIEHLLDTIECCDMPGQRHGIGGGTFIAQGKAMHTAFRQPAIIGAAIQAKGGHCIIDGPVEPGLTGNRIAERDIGMAGQELGDRVDHDIGATLKWPVGQRGCKGVVDRQKRAVIGRNLGDGWHIRNHDGGIGDHLHHDHFGLGPHGGGHGVRISWVHQCGSDPEFGQLLGQLAQCPSVELVGPNHMIAGFKRA